MLWKHRSKEGPFGKKKLLKVHFKLQKKKHNLAISARNKIEIGEVRKELQTTKMEEIRRNFPHVHTAKGLHTLRNIAGTDLIFNAGHVNKWGMWRKYARISNKFVKPKL